MKIKISWFLNLQMLEEKPVAPPDVSVSWLADLEWCITSQMRSHTWAHTWPDDHDSSFLVTKWQIAVLVDVDTACRCVAFCSKWGKTLNRPMLLRGRRRVGLSHIGERHRHSQWSQAESAVRAGDTRAVLSCVHSLHRHVSDLRVWLRQRRVNLQYQELSYLL